MSVPLIRRRSGVVILAAAGALFLLYPAVRPWADENTIAGATRSMSSGGWVAAHVFAMIGFILVPLGLLAVFAVVDRTRGASTARAAVVTGWVGAGLVLPYYVPRTSPSTLSARRPARANPSTCLNWFGRSGSAPSPPPCSARACCCSVWLRC